MNRKLKEVVIEAGVKIGADVLKRLLESLQSGPAFHYLIRLPDLEVLGPYQTKSEQEAAGRDLGLEPGESLLAASVEDNHRLVVTRFRDAVDWDEEPY